MERQVLRPQAQTKTSPSSTAKQFIYVDLVEKCTISECFAFSDDSNIREEIDSALMKISYKISLQYKKPKVGQEKS